MKFKLQDINPNPFRSLKRYPIKREKIQALKESFKTTSFWDNIVARRVGDKAEIAYGHHRLAALREVFKPSDEISLIVRDLSDEQMLQIMARENMEEWGTSAEIEQETIRATVQAYADGKIELERPPKDTSKNHIRYAPGFVAGDPRHPGAERPYTADSIGLFLGWVIPGTRAPQHKVKECLSALALIEEGVMKEHQFAGLGTKAAAAAVQTVQRYKKRSPEKAKKIAVEVTRKLRSGEISAKQTQREASRIAPSKPRGIPNVQDFVDKICTDLAHILAFDDPRLAKIESVIAVKDDVSGAVKTRLVRSLAALAARSVELVKKIAGEEDLKQTRHKLLAIADGRQFAEVAR